MVPLLNVVGTILNTHFDEDAYVLATVGQAGYPFRLIAERVSRLQDDLQDLKQRILKIDWAASLETGEVIYLSPDIRRE